MRRLTGADLSFSSPSGNVIRAFLVRHSIVVEELRELRIYDGEDRTEADLLRDGHLVTVMLDGIP